MISSLKRLFGGKTETDKAQQALAKTREKHQKEAPQKILLLGAGEVGKATIHKQFLNAYGNFGSPDELRSYAPLIRCNIFHALDELGQAREQNEYGLEDPEAELAYQTSYSKFDFEELSYMRSDSDFDCDGLEDLRSVWSDAGIQEAYRLRDRRASSGGMQSAAYFLDRLDVIFQPDYIPTKQDVFRVRIRTTGIVESIVHRANQPYKVILVGGQRSERKKWIHIFPNADHVIFVVNPAAYNQTLYEDASMNRLYEDLKIFDQIANSGYFAQIPITLVFTFMDEFKEKIEATPLSPTDRLAISGITDAFIHPVLTSVVMSYLAPRRDGPSPMADYFPEYKGPWADADAALAFIVEKFLSQVSPGREFPCFVESTGTPRGESKATKSNSSQALQSITAPFASQGIRVLFTCAVDEEAMKDTLETILDTMITPKPVRTNDESKHIET